MAFYAALCFSYWCVKKVQIPAMNHLNQLVGIPVKYTLISEIFDDHGNVIRTLKYPE